MSGRKSREMGVLKPSVRSRGVGPTVPNGRAPHSEVGTTLASQLKSFESNSFDPESYFQSQSQNMSEKSIRNLCTELVNLKKASAEEMRRSVYANYAAFIRTSREISDLEGELLAMRNLLSTQAALVHGLADGVQLESTPEVPFQSANFVEECSLSELEKRVNALPDILDILIVERRVDEAIAMLEEGRMITTNGAQKDKLSPSALEVLQEALFDRRAMLAEQLTEVARQSSVRGKELRVAISALNKLGDGPRAHTLLLGSHHNHLHNSIQELRPLSTSYGGLYTMSLSQLVFSALSQGAKDSSTVFGEQPAYASELLLWACNETENFATLVKRHALSSAAAAGGLRVAAECAQIALAHCSLLEAHGLALCPVLLKLFRPSVEQALESNLKRIEESLPALAASDDWILVDSSSSTYPSHRASQASIGLGSPIKLSSSAHRFYSMVQDFFEDVSPLIKMQLDGLLLDGLAHLFESYISLLVNAIRGLVEEENPEQPGDGSKCVKPAQTEAQQLGVLANALTLAEELLPRGAAKLFPNAKEEPRRKGNQATARMPELREWRRRLQRQVDGLRNHFCQQQILDLIYTEEGYANLSAETYLSLDGEDIYSQSEPMPSPFFQDFFARLNKFALVAVDIFSGRERAAVLLLTRLVETFVIWLSNDQNFWEELEAGQRALNPLGLQQFVLDMHFIIQMAFHGHYQSRQMRQVVGDIINRGIESFARSGLDSNSVLSDYEWLNSAALAALQTLLAKSGASAEPGSPTHSVSNQSITSGRSHGSP